MIYNNWIRVYIKNPLKTWWKARKYFKFPKINFHFTFYKNGYYGNEGKILHIESCDLGWKDKFDSPRHEYNPFIKILFFRKFGFYITFTMWYKNEFNERNYGDLEYWEYILNYLYYNTGLKGYSTWKSDSRLYFYVEKYGDKDDGSEDVIKPIPNIVPCVAISLNKKGIKELKRILNEERTNSRND